MGTRSSTRRIRECSPRSDEGRGSLRRCDRVPADLRPGDRHGDQRVPGGSRVSRRDRPDDRRVEPGLAAARARLPGAPNVLIIVLDDTGFGQLGCYGSPIATPNLDALAADGLRYNNMHTTALCSPSRSCIITGRNHHRNGMAAHHRARHRLSRATTASSRSRTASCRRCCVEHGYNTFMVGKWHLTPSEQETAAGPVRPLAARPRLRALLRVPRRRHQPVVSRPGLRQPPGRAAARRPRRATTSPRTWSTRRSQFIADAKQVDPGQAVLPAPLLRRHARPAPRRRRSGRTGTRGSSTTAGTPTARRSSRAQKELGHRPGRRRAVPARPGRPRLGRRCPRRRAGCTAG